ncbi:MAG: hypothetical protein KKB20_07730 [Proteobacteria bacterium]|nr:hypothetical protein [Pseudomonadota bacterium]
MTAPDPPPACFGILDDVFPPGPDDLRSVRPSCTECPRVKACLKAASESPAGFEMRARRLEAAGASDTGGLRGFLLRWSELKQARQRAGRKTRPRG